MADDSVLQRKRGPQERPLSERFWEKVNQGSEDQCWEWIGTRNNKGYGRVYVSREKGPKFSHRVSWELINGHIPEGKYILHRCDNPPCCNPAHLFVGTHLDNIRDMIAKGRRRDISCVLRGEDVPKSKLTYNDVKFIRESNLSCGSLGSILGVSGSTIKAVRQRRNWAHIK